MNISTPECLAGPVQETQRGSEGPGPGTQPPGLQGGGGLGETLPVPGGRGTRRPLPAREQGGAGREHRGEIPQVRCLSPNSPRSKKISPHCWPLSIPRHHGWSLSEKIFQDVKRKERKHFRL